MYFLTKWDAKEDQRTPNIKNPTPWKINMEHDHGGLEDAVAF